MAGSIKMEKDWLREQIAKLDIEIDGLKMRRQAFVDVLAKFSGEDQPARSSSETGRRRSANITPLVLDIMAEVGATGATSKDVDERVRERVPTVARGTVAAVLSRLKGDAALVYDGIRYYDARSAPGKPPPIFRVAQ
jgi:hypothetical protein